MIDCHLHLKPDELFFETEKKAKKYGITEFFVCSTSPDDWSNIEQISRASKQVTPFFGIHPWFAKTAICNYPSWETRLKTILLNNPAAGLGEIGLDKLKPDYDLQQKIFIKQVHIATELNRIINLHQIKSLPEIHQIFSNFSKLPPIIIHSFQGSPQMVEDLLKFGCYFSVSPKILHKTQEQISSVLQHIPPHKLLLESDYEGSETNFKNFPNLIFTISDILAISTKELINLIKNNIIAIKVQQRNI